MQVFNQLPLRTDALVIPDQSNNLRLIEEKTSEGKLYCLFFLLLTTTILSFFLIKFVYGNNHFDHRKSSQIDWNKHLSNLDSKDNIIGEILKLRALSSEEYHRLSKISNISTLKSELNSNAPSFSGSRLICWMKFSFYFWIITFVFIRLIGYSRLYLFDKLEMFRKLIFGPSRLIITWLFLCLSTYWFSGVFLEMMNLSPSQLGIFNFFRYVNLLYILLFKIWSLRYKNLWKHIDTNWNQILPSIHNLQLREHSFSSETIKKKDSLTLRSYIHYTAISNIIFLIGSHMIIFILLPIIFGFFNSSDVEYYEIFKQLINWSFIKEMFLFRSFHIVFFDLAFLIANTSLAQGSLSLLTKESDFSFILRLLWGISRKSHCLPFKRNPEILRMESEFFDQLKSNWSRVYWRCFHLKNQRISNAQKTQNWKCFMYTLKTSTFLIFQRLEDILKINPSIKKVVGTLFFFIIKQYNKILVFLF